MNPKKPTGCMLPHTDKVGPGDPAAHRTGCLPLLPSGSSGVHRVLLHRAQPLFSNLNPLKQPALKVCLFALTNDPYVVRSGRYTRGAVWRRGWDSNPRSRCRDACFPSMSIRPLSHLSASRSAKVGILTCVSSSSKATNGAIGQVLFWVNAVWWVRQW